MVGRVWAVALVALGCGKVTSASGDGGGGGADAMPGSLVGLKNDLYLTEDGLVTRPVDLSDVTIQVLVDGDEPIAGSGDAQGHFEILDVPSGEVLLQVDTTYLVTAERDLDLSRVTAGRPDPAVAGAGTSLALSITGLSGYTTANTFSLRVPNSGAVLGLDGNPPAGAEELTEAVTLDGQPLLDASERDIFRMTHLLYSQEADDTAVSVAIQAFQASVTSVNGTATTVAGNFTAPIVRDQEMTVDIREADFNALVPAVSGGTQEEGWPGFDVLAGPDIAGHNTGQVAVVNVFSQLGNGPVTLAYGNPFDEYVLTEQASLVIPYDLDPDPDLLVFAVGILSETGALGDLSGGPIRPGVGPVEDITVDGDPASEPQTVAPGAEVAWGAPTVGEPDIYVVILRRVPAAGGRGAILSRVLTPHPSIHLPPLDLESGSRIYLEIDAYVRAGFSARTPDLSTLRSSLSQVSTAILTVE